ncbi:MAG: 30S ribosome-binding factor RbfA [Bacteroidales bacterium]|jgi:ribosome-binding factor A|nr:30S ribosome-binding factor RbfA [Bacteroidales bacterium]
MDTTRQQKICQLIKKELADIFLEDGRSLYGCMITVTKTTISKDLSISRAYLSIYNTADVDVTMHEIRVNTKNIRFRMGQKLKNQLRIIPQLEFFVDDSLDYYERIEALLKQ